jgi:hypothetical protein
MYSKHKMRVKKRKLLPSINTLLSKPIPKSLKLAPIYWQNRSNVNTTFTVNFHISKYQYPQCKPGIPILKVNTFPNRIFEISLETTSGIELPSAFNYFVTVAFDKEYHITLYDC